LHTLYKYYFDFRTANVAIILLKYPNSFDNFILANLRRFLFFVFNQLLIGLNLLSAAFQQKLPAESDQIHKFHIK